MGLLYTNWPNWSEKNQPSLGVRSTGSTAFLFTIYWPNQDHMIGIFKIEESESFCRARRRILKFSVGNSNQPWVKKKSLPARTMFYPSFKNPFICQVLIAGALRYTWMQRWASWLFQFVFDLYYNSDSLFKKKTKNRFTHLNHIVFRYI